jgi:endo-1,4-beta-mannosidase
MPKTYYPPVLINNHGKDMAQNAQGIYYYNSFEKGRVPANRDLFIPSFENIDWDCQTEKRRRKRARIVEEHMMNNETFHKSEYAWEADAWSDIFGVMRNDNQLAM